MARDLIQMFRGSKENLPTLSQGEVALANDLGREKVFVGGQNGNVGVMMDSNYLGALKNKIINGNFDIWQRGASFSSVGYTADRWKVFVTGGTTQTVEKVDFVVGQSNVPNNPKSHARITVVGSGATSSACSFTQRLESVRTLAGKKLTISFWAKAETNKNLGVYFKQNFGSGGTPSSQVALPIQVVNIETGWKKYSLEFDITSLEGKTVGTNSDDCLEMTFQLDAGSDYDSIVGGVGNQSGVFDIAQVQIEEGEESTPFELRSLAQEELLCYRYYFKRISGNNIFSYAGYSVTSTNHRITIPTPVKMYTSPSVTILGTPKIVNETGNVDVTNILSTNIDGNLVAIVFDDEIVGTSVYENAHLQFTTSTDGLEFDAEL